MARHYYSLISRRASPQLAERFKVTLGLHALQHIWVIPKYDATKLHMTIKNHKGNSQEVQQARAQQTKAALLQWLAGTHSHYDHTYKQGEDMTDNLNPDC